MGGALFPYLLVPPVILAISRVAFKTSLALHPPPVPQLPHSGNQAFMSFLPYTYLTYTLCAFSFKTPTRLSCSAVSWMLVAVVKTHRVSLQAHSWETQLPTLLTRVVLPIILLWIVGNIRSQLSATHPDIQQDAHSATLPETFLLTRASKPSIIKLMS